MGEVSDGSFTLSRLCSLGVKVVGRKERKDSKGQSQELHVQAAASCCMFCLLHTKTCLPANPMQQPWRHFHDLNTKSRVVIISSNIE